MYENMDGKKQLRNVRNVCLSWFLNNDMMLRMMMDIKIKSVFCEGSGKSNLSAIFMSALDGKIRGANETAAMLLDVVGNVECLLPEDHVGLVRACLKTGQCLKRKCNIGDFCIVWSYQISEKINYVNVYGAEFAIEKDISNSKEESLENESLPLITFSQDGSLQYCNSATSEFLSELGFENVKDVLPFCHTELLLVCFQGELALTDARCINGKTYVWTYEANIESGVVKIHMRDLRVSHEKESVSGSLAWKKRELEFLADVSGATKLISFSTYKLLDELGVNGVDDILSTRHRGLLKACLATSTELTEERKLFNRSIVWTYYPHEDGESVRVYGYEAV